MLQTQGDLRHHRRVVRHPHCDRRRRLEVQFRRTDVRRVARQDLVHVERVAPTLRHPLPEQHQEGLRGITGSRPAAHANALRRERRLRHRSRARVGQDSASE